MKLMNVAVNNNEEKKVLKIWKNIPAGIWCKVLSNVRNRIIFKVHEETKNNVINQLDDSG